MNYRTNVSKVSPKLLYPIWGCAFLLFAFLSVAIIYSVEHPTRFVVINGDWMQYQDEFILEPLEEGSATIRLSTKLCGFASEIERTDIQNIKVQNITSRPVKFGLAIEDSSYGMNRIKPWILYVNEYGEWINKDISEWYNYLYIQKINNSYQTGMGIDFRYEEYPKAIIVGIIAVVCLLLTIYYFKKR